MGGIGIAVSSVAVQGFIARKQPNYVLKQALITAHTSSLITTNNYILPLLLIAMLLLHTLHIVYHTRLILCTMYEINIITVRE